MDWRNLRNNRCFIVSSEPEKISLIVEYEKIISRSVKWIGLGAIAGNVINNKINSDTAIKQGRTWRKSRKNRNNGFLDDFEEFVSPSYESDEEHELSDEESFREYQEFKKWKATQKGESSIGYLPLFFILTLIFFQMFLDDAKSGF